MCEEQSEPSTGEQAGVTMVDVLALPGELRTSVTWLMRQGEAGLPELAAHVEQDEATAGTLLADLVAQGFVQEVAEEGKGQPRYRVRLAAKLSIQPRRWVVERTFGWLSRSRRLSKDYERKVQTSETLIQVAMIRLLLARLGRRT